MNTASHRVADWLVPDWPAPAHVKAVFTTRRGGVSAAPFDTMNLGDHVGDAPAAVQTNRALLQRALMARPLFMQQVHGQTVAVLNEESQGPIVADACVTVQRGLACTVMVADCLPVLFTNRQGSAVAAAHAGWRGLAGVDGYGVLEAALVSFGAVTDAASSADRSELLAWLGPCIGPEAFEVGDEVKAAFVAQHAEAAALFVPHAPGKWLAHLPGLARLRLHALGLSAVNIYGNDGSAAWCTVGNALSFFSYRRERVCGRMAAVVWLD